MKISFLHKVGTNDINKLDESDVDNSYLNPGNLSFKEMLGSGSKLGKKNDIDKVEEKDKVKDLSSLLSPKDSLLIGNDLKAAFNYDSYTIDKDDAKFFVDMVNNTGQFALNAQAENNLALMKMDNASELSSYKSANVSKTLMNMIEDSYNTQKPVRLDFDNNVSVILKVDSEGKLSADFIPGDKAVETYLKNNIPFLKQRFEEQDLPYSELSYRQHRQQQNNNKKQNKGE